uniref:Uncharacterized protein n=1 Tax=Lepeophtheirus salmonis TaxID=72036 RepID=A0A0K2UD33_LEPSM
MMIFRVFSIFFGITASFGRPVRSASSVSVRPRLNHRIMVVFDRDESGEHF